MDGSMALILVAVLLFVVVAGSLFGADSRPGWRNVNRRPRFRMTGSMQPDDWERSESER
jgi:tryptophan-rich sensory protein